MGNFFGTLFGTLFRIIGRLLMVASVLWAFAVWAAIADKPSHSPAGNIAGFALLVGVPFLFGYGLSAIGGKLCEESDESFAAPPRVEDKPPEVVVTRRAVKSVFAVQPDAIDVDIAPESTPETVVSTPAPQRKSIKSSGATKPDPFAMGVDTLYNPDEDGKGGKK